MNDVKVRLWRYRLRSLPDLSVLCCMWGETFSDIRYGGGDDAGNGDVDSGERNVFCSE